MTDKSEVRFIARVDGMYEVHPKGSYALFEIVGVSGNDATRVRVSEQQAKDLVSMLSTAFSDA